MSEVVQIKKIDGIPIFSDPLMDRNSFMVMYEKTWLPPGIIHIPYENLDKLEEVTKDDDIIRKKKEKKLSDVKGIICNCPDEDIDKIIQSLYKNFN
jgi:hypothetical protein